MSERKEYIYIYIEREREREKERKRERVGGRGEMVNVFGNWYIFILNKSQSGICTGTIGQKG